MEREKKVYSIYALHPKGKNFTPEQTYVGKTKRELRSRFYNHKSHSREGNTKVNQYICEFGPENMEMELIERCVGEREAARLEGYWAEVLGAGLNSDRPGSCIGPTSKEYHRNN